MPTITPAQQNILTGAGGITDTLGKISDALPGLRTAGTTTPPPTNDPNSNYTGIDGNTYDSNGQKVTGLTDRYSGDRSKINAAFPTTAPDENQIISDYRNRAQAAVNAINTKYATIDAQDNQQIDSWNREQRASNVLNGLSGSKTGSGRQIKVDQAGAELKDRTAEQKNAEVQAILANAETRGSEEFGRQRSEFLAAQKDKFAAEQALDARIRENAMNELTTLAGGSKSFDQLKQSNPALIQQYLKETGLSEEALQAQFLKAGEANWEKIKEVDGNGKTVLVYRNKATGEVKTEEINLPAGLTNDYKFYPSVGKDGAWVNENAASPDYQKVRFVSTSSAAASSGKSTSDSLFTSEDKRTLLGGGFSLNDIDALAKDVALHGAATIMNRTDLSDAQKKAVKTVLNSATAATNEFLTRSYLAEMAGLKDSYDISNGSKFFGGESGGKQLDALEAQVKRYRTAGYTDKDILKLISE